MSIVSTKFKVFKKKLANGLTVLAKPLHHVPRVETHLWYNVGSKDEESNQRGIAHLIEHMMFKGTKKLSESDINVVCQKLTGEANAFTSQDYTCYTFRMPSHVWETSLELLAECMQHTRFDSDMLASELKAVIEELRLYKEDFQGALLESMIAGLFPEHPYHNPVIGSKYDLCSINRDTLLAFYKKHYHPTNAVLVVVGDIKPNDVFKMAEKHFGSIPSPENYSRQSFFIADDLVSKTTTLFRPTSTPWYCFAYKIPGLQEVKNHLVDLANLILASGRSSRLYNRLVNKEKIAVEVDCSAYDFFEKGALVIGVWPMPGASVDTIEKYINEEIHELCTKLIHDWEFEAVKKRTLVDFSALLESTEKQALVIGNSYLATGDTTFVEKYLRSISSATKKQIQSFFKKYFITAQQHKGQLLPVAKQDVKHLVQLQQDSELVDQKILYSHVRKTSIEEPKWANSIHDWSLTNFSYPKPETFTLPNGLEVIFHHNPLVPNVVGILNFKANYLYEPAHLAGSFSFLLRTITDCTTQHTPEQFAQLLETEGIHLAAGADSIIFRSLNVDLEKIIHIISTILKKPCFNPESIEKIRQGTLSDISELWDSPIDFVDLVAREFMYQKHPYHKNPLGTKDSIQKLSKKVLMSVFEEFITPQQSSLVLVGDLSKVKLKKMIAKYFGGWKGVAVPNLQYPPIIQLKPQKIALPLNRDQMVLAFVAPSVSRKDVDYNAMALLDIIITGGAQASPSSKLFQLREQSGLFYTIGGSLIYGARDEQGMIFIKTLVATDKTEQAQKLIINTLDAVGKNGITEEELNMAKNTLFSASIELFESNGQMAQTFLFLKKMGLSFNLFDKQGEILSILKVDRVNEIARRFCSKDVVTTIKIGRVTKTQKVSLKKRRTF